MPGGGEITTRSLLDGNSGRSSALTPAALVTRRHTTVTGADDRAARAAVGRLADVVLGEPIGRSWILLFGLRPVDYDELTLVRLERERGFLERSRMLSQRAWEHERTLEPHGGGCIVTDRVAFVPRLRLPPDAFRSLFAAVFRHRHRRLRRRFGGRDLGQSAG